MSHMIFYITIELLLVNKIIFVGGEWPKVTIFYCLNSMKRAIP